MRTEISAKFRREGITAELHQQRRAGRSWWTDAQARFGLSLSVGLTGPGEGAADAGRGRRAGGQPFRRDRLQRSQRP